MAVRSKPIFIDGNTHPAEEHRLMTQSVLRGTAGSFAGGVGAADSAHGVARTTDLAVTANGTPNMTVNVGIGGAFVRGTQSAMQGAYHLYNDATVNLPVAAADATNPRRDLVIAQVRDANYSGATSDARVVVVTGTPAASPSDPSLSSYPNALVLARITVTAAKTSIVAGDITDLRTLAGFRERSPIVASTTARDQFLPSPVAGQLCYIDSGDTNEGLYTYNGSAWVRDGALIPHTTARGLTAWVSSTNSTSWATPGGISSLSFTKYRADTNVVMTLYVGGYYVTTTDFANWGIQINGVDYATSLSSGAATNNRQYTSGTAVVTGLAAGSYTAVMRWRVSGGGGGTINSDGNGGYSMTLTETYA